MNNCISLSPKIEPTQLTAHFGGKITGFDTMKNYWVVDHYFYALPSINLLVQPCIGDQVRFIEMNEQYYITDLLSRVDNLETITLLSDKKVHWQAPEIKLTAFENLELTSLNKIMVTSKDYVMSAANTMVQYASNLLQQVEHYSLTAKGLLRQSGKQQLITAEKDVRIDGKRINMG